jgi:hypothetical protein
LLEKMSISVFFFLIHFLFIEKLKKKRTAWLFFPLIELLVHSLVYLFILSHSLQFVFLLFL